MLIHPHAEYGNTAAFVVTICVLLAVYVVSVVQIFRRGG